MPSKKQKREAEIAKKKAAADKQKAAKEKSRKERELAKEKAAKAAKEAKDRRESLKVAAAARKKAALQQTQSLKKASSPRQRGNNKRDSASTTTSVTSAETQGGQNKAKIIDPPTLKKNLVEDFEKAMGLEEQREGDLSVGSGKKVPYIPKDLEPNNDTGRSIVDDATFAIESVDMDFSKDDTKQDPDVLLQKVQDKILLCNTTPDDLDAIRFLTIIENFKVSNFGHIFNKNGFPTKAEQPEFLGVKLLFDAC